MTFKEFADKGLWCDNCPIKKEGLCSFGSTGGFDDPPCSFADPDQDMNEWIAEENEKIRQYEERESKRLQKERAEQKKRAEINAKRREKQKAMELYCKDEIEALNGAMTALMQISIRIDQAEIKAEIINSTNAFFRYAERVSVPKTYYRCQEDCRVAYQNAQDKYTEKKKEFYKNYKGK